MADSQYQPCITVDSEQKSVKVDAQMLKGTKNSCSSPLPPFKLRDLNVESLFGF
jgi:hypothetical protein